MKRSPLAALTAILAALFVFGTAAPAMAHDTLKSSNPAKGAKIKTLDEVKLEFSAKVRMPFVIVRGDGDTQLQSGKPEVDGAVVTQAVGGPLPDGKYTIAYRVVSSDGHPIEGEIPFRVEGAPAASPSPSESGPESGAPAEAGSSASPPAGQAASPPAQAGEQSLAPDRAVAVEEPAFPVWLIIVIGALVGVGIGFLLSARKKKP
ncbi:copper resistance CopC family protein [Nonomuraea zeae]|uniref:Copper resistance protein CopC n=1 Tax=Nonomuraea zeae TaxID=1642303 RepID=A0A5S4FSF0_9ACTN|nr:copper resistance CopC family protein [Nonomuraea zeae]TMR23061.1 copper resistance protein CopC [Nonomuraea zeae]